MLDRWEDIKAFETSLKQSEGKPIYTFYDGRAQSDATHARRTQRTLPACPLMLSVVVCCLQVPRLPPVFPITVTSWLVRSRIS